MQGWEEDSVEKDSEEAEEILAGDEKSRYNETDRKNWRPKKV